MSVLSSPTGRQRHRAHPLRATVLSLAGLLCLLAVGALQGGVAMVVDPMEPLGMPVSYLEGTPVDDYFWPGVFLLGIAIASILSGIGLLFGWHWNWAQEAERRIGYRWPWVGSVMIGSLLLVFELIELFVVPFHPVMHPLLIASSLAIIWLTLTSSVRSELGVDGPG